MVRRFCSIIFISFEIGLQLCSGIMQVQKLCQDGFEWKCNTMTSKDLPSSSNDVIDVY